MINKEIWLKHKHLIILSGGLLSTALVMVMWPNTKLTAGLQAVASKSSAQDVLHKSRLLSLVKREEGENWRHYPELYVAEDQKKEDSAVVAAVLSHARKTEVKVEEKIEAKVEAKVVTPPAAVVSPDGGQLSQLKVFGKIEEEGVQTIFVTRNGVVIIARAGDVLDGSIRLDRIENGTAFFTHIPTGTSSTQVIGDSK